jgi:heme A synthase
MDSVQSFMTWSLALIGAVAYFLKSSLEGDLELQRSDFGLCLVVVVLAVISMFFGTLVQNDAFQLLGNGTVPVRNERVMRLGACQYLSFLAALLAFGLHVVQFFTRARRPSATAGTPSSEESGST